MTKFNHVVAVELPGSRLSKKTGWETRYQPAGLLTRTIRWLIMMTLAFIVAVVLFLILSLSSTTYFIKNNHVQADIGTDNAEVQSSQNSIVPEDTPSGTAAICEYAKMLSADPTLPGHSNVPVTEGEGLSPSSPRPTGISGGTAMTLSANFFAGQISGLMQTKISWYLLVIIPNMLLFVCIIKHLVDDIWPASPVRIYPD